MGGTVICHAEVCVRKIILTQMYCLYTEGSTETQPFISAFQDVAVAQFKHLHVTNEPCCHTVSEI